MAQANPAEWLGAIGSVFGAIAAFAAAVWAAETVRQQAKAAKESAEAAARAAEADAQRAALDLVREAVEANNRLHRLDVAMVADYLLLQAMVGPQAVPPDAPAKIAELRTALATLEVIAYSANRGLVSRSVVHDLLASFSGSALWFSGFAKQAREVLNEPRLWAELERFILSLPPTEQKP